MTAVSPPGSSVPGLPPEQGIGQLRWLIERVAAGELPVDALIGNFRTLYEASRALAGRSTAPRKRRA